MFELTLYPALDGDCHVLAWGDAAAPHRLLIDGGREATWATLKKSLQALPAAQRQFELFVVSHIDADHIAGALRLIEDDECPVTFSDVWFNAYHHLVSGDWETLGVEQGEQLSDAIDRRKWPWARCFKGKAVAVDDPAKAPQVKLPGNLTVTLLSPTPAKLRPLVAKWKTWLREEGIERGHELRPAAVVPEGFEVLGKRPDVERLAAMPDKEDKAVPNGSSIAFIAEYEGKRVLLTADAHPDIIANALGSLTDDARRFDLAKVPHHGSAENTTKAMLQRIDATRYVFSTNGKRNAHPRPVTVAKILKTQDDRRAHDPGRPRTTLYFNYRHDEATIWNDQALMADYKYDCVYCPEGDDGRLTIPI
jgi:beta-lactamase superfamily II metal-dependent hydrolase